MIGARDTWMPRAGGLVYASSPAFALCEDFAGLVIAPANLKTAVTNDEPSVGLSKALHCGSMRTRYGDTGSSPSSQALT